MSGSKVDWKAINQKEPPARHLRDEDLRRVYFAHLARNYLLIGDPAVSWRSTIMDNGRLVPLRNITGRPVLGNSVLSDCCELALLGLLRGILL